ncbi:hypothetical protein EDD85DRAFT_962002 [Armillaria nabsnona]|nr:hypothetical protein EDD85DRAFT_962002 [Armillaria nabsnona]
MVNFNLTAKHETAVALARKHAVTLAQDKGNLQQIDRLVGSLIGSEAQRPPTSNTTEGRQDEDYLTPVEYGNNLFSNAASTNKRNKADTSSLFGDEMDGEIIVLWCNLDRALYSPFFARSLSPALWRALVC